MNTIQKIIVGICIMSVPFISSCGKDDPQDCNYVTETQGEYDNLTVALNAYIADQSTANCNAYKASFQAYLNALQDHDNCVLVGQEAAYQDALANAQASINAIVC